MIELLLTIFALFFGFFLILAIWSVVSFNNLRALEARCDQAQQDVDVQLKRRSDLLPNLTSTVKSFVGQENNLIGKLHEIQMSANASNQIKNKARKMQDINSNISSVFAQLDQIPELQSSHHYVQLRKELLDVEDRIEASRRFQNLAAAEFNKKRAQFPGSIIAGISRMDKKDGYSLGADRVFYDEAPSVNI